MNTTTTLKPEFEDVAAEKAAYISLRRSVGGPRCGHPGSYLVAWDALFCGLCFLRDGYAGELPHKLHLSKTLADNGKPQQAGKLQAHVQVAEGFIKPLPGENLEAFRLARERIYGRPSRQLFPFSCSLWDLMGQQPPLAEPLILAVLGRDEWQVAAKMNVSVVNVVERITKGIALATKKIRRYDNAADDRKPAPRAGELRNTEPQPDAGTRNSGDHKARKRSRHA